MKDKKVLFLASILAGAIGDALGYTVEFKTLIEIRMKFGRAGITDLVRDKIVGKALISDDTQMTLFTIDGIRWVCYSWPKRDVTSNMSAGVYHSYIRWLYTQNKASLKEKDKLWLKKQLHEEVYSILEYEELFSKRLTRKECLSALESGRMGTIEEPINNSKGCGGVVRVAPIGLFFHRDPEIAFNIGAEVAAITNGNPTGYLAGGAFAMIIAEIINGKSIIESARLAVHKLEEYPNHEEVKAGIINAIKYSQSNIKPEVSIEMLGEGWVADEALSIALYCALKEDDFRKALVMAVNHNGDSNSTGAICGNILGAYYGIDVIPKSWINKLELKELVFDVSNKLFNVCEGIY